jgi:hypothetical protein
MTHGRDCPDRCSICLGSIAKRVDQTSSTITVDGEPARQIDPGLTEAQRRYARRGGKR